MSNTASEEAAAAWDAASDGYAEYVAPRMMENYADAIVERLQPSSDDNALEVAAGSGALTATLAKRVKSLLATDLSPKMVERLRVRVGADGSSNVTCEVMDGQQLALDDNRFDRAASSFGLMLFPDRAKGFGELRRVLRSGGRAVLSAWTAPPTFELFGLFLSSVSKAFPDLPPPPGPPPVFSLADPTQFKAEMEAAGFRDVEVDLVARELTASGIDDLWAMLTSGAPPVQALFDRVGPEGKQRLRDTLGGVVRERFGDGPITTRNVATMGTGVA